MKPTSFENAIRLQFDTLMKKVIDGIIKNYEKELDRRSNREIPFCELPKIVVNSFPVFDDYELDVTICLRPLYDEYGNLYIAVDMELKGRIREAMIKKMRAFEVNIK